MSSSTPSEPLLTFGHGTAGEEELVAALHGAEVEVVVDVRRHPGSRRHPHVARREMERWLPAAGIGYRWDPRLGGRREPADTSPHDGSLTRHAQTDPVRVRDGRLLYAGETTSAMWEADG